MPGFGGEGLGGDEGGELIGGRGGGCRGGFGHPEGGGVEDLLVVGEFERDGGAGGEMFVGGERDGN